MSDPKTLRQILICKICNECYEDPVILPCGKSICSKHAISDKEAAKDNVFKCLFCVKNHPISSDGFIKNEELNKLLDVADKYAIIDDMLGKRNKKAIELCTELEELIKQSEILSKDPYLFIYDYFSKLKSDLDLNREQCIQMINVKYHRFLSEIEEAESNAKKH